MLPKIRKIKHNKKIEIIDGLFNDEDIKYLYNPKRNMSYGWKANSGKDYDPGHWNYFVCGVKDSKDEIYNVDYQTKPEFTNSQLFGVWNKIKKVIGDRRILRCYFNGYTYGTEGYVHKDQTETIPGYRQETILVYCTKDWKLDWAGETQFFDDKEVVFSTLPLPNRIVCFDSSIPHVARSVSRTYSGLRTILAFKTSVFDIDELRCVEYIKEQTDSINHSKSTFFEHLYNTYNILKNMGLPQDVCIAGLFHSVYGTEYFKCALPVTREEIKELIGEYSESLAYSFCTLPNRTSTIINEGKKGNSKLFHLACIEYANLLEQQPRIGNEKMKQSIDELYSIIYN
jgi:hypothetical protein